MADNTELAAGSGGDVISTDDIGGGVKVQRVKMQYGVDGSATDVSDSNPMPIDDAGGSLTVDDGGASLTVDGTVTANLSATDNAVLDAIAASVAGTLTVGLPSGAATAANQSTANTALSAIQTAVQLLDNTVSGTELQVDVVGALPAGTNAIGKLAANTGVDIGDVDVTSVTPGTAAASLGKAEDAAHATGDVGVLALAVRRDTAAVGSGTDGDNSTLNVDATGRLWTHDPVAAALLTTMDADTGAIAASLAGTLTVDGSGSTQPVSGTVTANLSATDNAVLDTIASPVATVSSTPLQRVAIFDASDTQITSFGGGTEYTEDAAAAANPVGKANILVRADTPAGVASADGDNVAQRGTNFGAAYCQIVDSSGNFIDSFGGAGGTSSADDADFTAGTTLGTIAQGVYESTPTSVTDGDVGAVGITSDRQLKTSDAAAVALLTTIDADTGSAAALLGTIDADTSALAGAVSGTEMQVDVVASLPAGSNTIGVVDLGATDNAVLDAIAASVAGTLTVDLGANNDVIASGAAAHDAAVSGNPVRVAARAQTADFAAVATGDTVDLLATILGKQVVMPYSLPGNTWQYAAGSGGITNTTGVTAKAAAGAGIVNYITHVSVVNAHATVGTDVQIRDGASGTVLWRSYAVAPGGGVSEKFDPPLKGTANTLVEVANGTTGAATYFNLQGYVAAE